MLSADTGGPEKDVLQNSRRGYGSDAQTGSEWQTPRDLPRWEALAPQDSEARQDPVRSPYARQIDQEGTEAGCPGVKGAYGGHGRQRGSEVWSMRSQGLSRAKGFLRYMTQSLDMIMVHMVYTRKRQNGHLPYVAYFLKCQDIVGLIRIYQDIRDITDKSEISVPILPYTTNSPYTRTSRGQRRRLPIPEILSRRSSRISRTLQGGVFQKSIYGFKNYYNKIYHKKGSYREVFFQNQKSKSPLPSI